jgi:hypothetical protein
MFSAGAVPGIDAALVTFMRTSSSKDRPLSGNARSAKTMESFEDGKAHFGIGAANDFDANYGIALNPSRPGADCFYLLGKIKICGYL